MTPGLVAESDLGGTLKSEHVFFDGEPVTRRDGATGTSGASITSLTTEKPRRSLPTCREHQDRV